VAKQVVRETMSQLHNGQCAVAYPAIHPAN
jgi:hypothetical protein